jgi:GNAT superfamily N-acetyltransferase
MDHTGAKSFTVRRARLSYMPGLQDVFLRASMSNENDRPFLLQHPELVELSDDAVRGGRTQVAVDQSDAVIGFASYLITGGMAELVEAFVDPLHVRCGVGRALVADVFEQVGEMNYESLVVIANPGATAFYEHMGFEADQLVDTEGSPALRMRKPFRRD